MGRKKRRPSTVEVSSISYYKFNQISTAVLMKRYSLMFSYVQVKIVLGVGLMAPSVFQNCAFPPVDWFLLSHFLVYVKFYTVK